MNETISTYPLSRKNRLRYSRGFTLIEVLIGLAIMTGIMVFAFRIEAQSQNQYRYEQPQKDIVHDATRNLESELNSLADFNPTTLTQQLTPGKTIQIVTANNPTQHDLAIINRNVTFTVVNVTPKTAETYDVAFTYKVDASGFAGNITVPVHRMGTVTPGCDPSNGITTSCNNYVVPGQ